MNRIAKTIWEHSPALLGLAISGILLFFALRDVHPAEIIRAISQAQPRWLPLMCAVIAMDLWIRALRWRLLLPEAPASRPVRVWQLFKLEAIGLGINNVVFLRIGELVRAYLAGQELDIPTMTSIATIMIERALDMIALTLIFAVAADIQSDVVPNVFGNTAFLVAVGLIFALVLLSLSTRFLTTAPAAHLKRISPKIHELLEHGIRGAQSIRSWSVALRVTFLSFALWLVDTGLYWIGARAMHMQPSLSYGRSILILSTAAASNFLPAVPGAFGTFEQAVKVLLIHLGFDGTVALSYAGFVHIVNYLTVTGLGILFLYQAGHTIASLKALRHSR